MKYARFRSEYRPRSNNKNYILALYEDVELGFCHFSTCPSPAWAIFRENLAYRTLRNIKLVHLWMEHSRLISLPKENKEYAVEYLCSELSKISHEELRFDMSRMVIEEAWQALDYSTVRLRSLLEDSPARKLVDEMEGHSKEVAEKRRQHEIYHSKEVVQKEERKKKELKAKAHAERIKKHQNKKWNESKKI